MRNVLAAAAAVGFGVLCSVPTTQSATCFDGEFSYQISATTINQFWNNRQVEVSYKGYKDKTTAYIDCKDGVVTGWGPIKMDLPVSPKRMSDDVATHIKGICQ